MHKLQWLVPFLILLLTFLLKIGLQSPTATGVAKASRLDLEPLQVSYKAESLKKLSFGYESFLSSLIWIRLLQQGQLTPLKRDALSWEFSEINSVTTLDPKFEIAYSFGASYVSFFRRDKEGGLLLLEKWIKHRPNYWKTHYLLGMHYFLELHDPSKAAPHILRASQLDGAPPYLTSLGIGLLGESGALGFALQSALELFQATVNEEAQSRLIKRIRSLRWTLEKRKWEMALKSFSKQHPKKNPANLSDLSPFVSEDLNREIASLILAKSQSEDLRALLSESFSFKLSAKGNQIESVNSLDPETFSHTGIYIPKDGL